MKITANELKYIDNRMNVSAPTCNYELYQNASGGYTITSRIKLWFYILMFIPSCLFQFFMVLWDGGLKEFTLEPRTLPDEIIQPDRSDYEGPSRYKRATEIWNRH